MKHWCFYANVVRYLEKLEANAAAQKKNRGALLVWRDDDGPHMIAGPGIYWHRGAGPMPNINGLKASIGPTGAARVSKRSPANAQSIPEKANKRRTTFPKPAQICSPKQQRRGRKSALGPAPAGPLELGHSDVARPSRRAASASTACRSSRFRKSPLDDRFIRRSPRSRHPAQSAPCIAFHPQTSSFSILQRSAETSVTPRPARRIRKIEGILSSQSTTDSPPGTVFMGVRMQRFLILFFLSALLAPAQQFSKGNWRTDTSKKSIDLNDLKLGGPPKDGIMAIQEPKFISPKDAASWVGGGEPVIVVELDGDARAYPLQVLLWHEMVSDQIGDVPLLVTYCPLCNSSIAFDRRVDGKVYEFGVSGMLRHSDMIMFDRETDSLWQQLTGEAVVGSLTGKRLDVVTSQVVDFAEYSRSFPDGKVLSKDNGQNLPYGNTPYAGYEQAGRVMFPAEVKRPIGPPLERVVSFTLEGKSRAYTFERLRQAGVIDGKIKKTRYVVFYDGAALSTMEQKQIKASRQVGSAGVFFS